MTKLVLQAQPEAFEKYSKYWTTVPALHVRRIARQTVKSIPLSSTFEIKYQTLLSKIDKLRAVEPDGEDGEYFVSEITASSAREVINELAALQVMEQNIGVHVLSNFDGGIQIELDGKKLKADIEILADGSIVLTIYRGRQNVTEEYQLTVDSLDLINEYLGINEFVYA